MHVMIIPSWYPVHPGDIGGSFFREQAIALQKNGCKVGVIFHQNHSLRSLSNVTVEIGKTRFSNDCGVATYRYDGINWFPKMRRLAMRSWLRRGSKLFNEYITLNGKPDIIHAHSLFNAGILAKLISNNTKIPFILTEHSSVFIRDMVSSGDIAVAEPVIADAKALLAVSDNFCNLLNQKFRGFNEWTCIPNMVQDEFFREIKRSSKNKTFKFINVAYVDSNKNQKIILHAFKNEFNGEDCVRLIIGGDGPGLEKLKDIARTLNILNKVEFTGTLSREQVRKKMGASDAFVLSSHHETFGVVVIEALAIGLPVIATKCGGPESIVRKEDGILVPVDDVESLGKAMRKIYEDSNTYNKEKIRESCRERFSEKVVADKLIKIYGNVVSGKRSNGS